MCPTAGTRRAIRTRQLCCCTTTQESESLTSEARTHPGTGPAGTPPLPRKTGKSCDCCTWRSHALPPPWCCGGRLRLPPARRRFTGCCSAATKPAPNHVRWYPTMHGWPASSPNGVRRQAAWSPCSRRRLRQWAVPVGSNRSRRQATWGQRPSPASSTARGGAPPIRRWWRVHISRAWRASPRSRTRQTNRRWNLLPRRPRKALSNSNTCR